MSRLTPLLAVLLAASVACGGAGARGSEGSLLVFAASSLTETFTKIGAGFERAFPHTAVRFNFGPSDGLATGISEGARADVFAAASEGAMDIVDDSPGTSGRTVFARNKLVVITPRNEARVSSLKGLAEPGVKLVVAAPGVPAGKYARMLLKNLGLRAATKNIVSNEIDVKGVVQKVVLGEADAGIAYLTDVTPAVGRNVRTLAIPDPFNVLATYPIALVTSARIPSGSGVVTPHARQARAFVSYVLGPGQAILRAAGFLPPP